MEFNMLQKSPVLTPSLENLSYILRHREWWPDGFEWNFRYLNSCGIGLSQYLWRRDPYDLHHGLVESTLTGTPNETYYRIFATRIGKIAWYRCFPWNYQKQMRSITPEQVADQIDRFLAKHHG
jgi:hypothetical protein